VNIASSTITTSARLAVESVDERAPEALGEDRDEHDDAEADHERRRRRGGAGRVAGRVVAGEAAARAEDLLERPAEHPRDRPHDVLREHREGDEDEHGAEPHLEQPRGRRRRPKSPERRDARADAGGHRRRPACEAAKRLGGSAAPSCSAATGGTRVARRAGARAPPPEP
jgi:hypothetical protein